MIRRNRHPWLVSIRANHRYLAALARVVDAVLAEKGMVKW